MDNPKKKTTRTKEHKYHSVSRPGDANDALHGDRRKRATDGEKLVVVRKRDGERAAAGGGRTRIDTDKKRGIDGFKVDRGRNGALGGRMRDYSDVINATA